MPSIRVAVIGAQGVFGSLAVAELARINRVDVVAQARGDFNFTGVYAVACTAGPFQRLDRSMVTAAVEQGAHWLDIADDRGWFFGLIDNRELDTAAKSAGVCVVPGLSTLPAISCALANRVDTRDVEIVLEIGNRNRKGAAAIASAATFDPPDPELLLRERGIQATVRVRFELPFASRIVDAIRSLTPDRRLRAAKILSAAAAPLSVFGSSGGAVEVRGGGVIERLEGDQRMAILPMVFALDELLSGRRIVGVQSPTSALEGERLLAFLEEAGGFVRRRTTG